jgi:cytochrome b subunit of formate dehydrogenase
MGRQRRQSVPSLFRSMRILLKVLYWLAVLAISLALVVGLILWFESQDESDIQGSGLPSIRSD